MAITFQYGVTDALGLAQKAGEGLRRRQQQAADLAYLEAVNRAQAEANRKRASEVSAALQAAALGQEADQAAARNAQQQEALALRQRELAALEGYRRAGLDQRAMSQQSLDAYRQQMAQLANTKFQTKQEAIKQLPEEVQPVVQATGRLPQEPRERDASTDLRAEYSRLRTDMAAAERALKAAAFDPTDFELQMTARPSKSVPGAIEGKEAEYLAASQARAALQQRLAQLDAALAAHTAPVLGVAPPPVRSPAMAPPPPVAPAVTGGPDPTTNLPVVNTAEEHAKLPSGSLYIDAADGQVYRKK